jgi:hypothetical protein
MDEGHDACALDEVWIDNARTKVVRLKPGDQHLIGGALGQTDGDIHVGRQPCNAVQDRRAGSEYVPSDA